MIGWSVVLCMERLHNDEKCLCLELGVAPARYARNVAASASTVWFQVIGVFGEGVDVYVSEQVRSRWVGGDSAGLSSLWTTWV